MKSKPVSSPAETPALFVGIDWADAAHEAFVVKTGSNGKWETIEQNPQKIQEWVASKIRQANGGKIGIIIEQSRGALIHALLNYPEVIIYPVNPKQLARYRDSFRNAGSKNDTRDAYLLARMLRERHGELKPLQLDDQKTRKLTLLCQIRRKHVEERRRLGQQLLQHLKNYAPLVLELKISDVSSPLMLALLKRWPDPRKLKRADRRALRTLLTRHGIRNPERQQELIHKLRSTALLTRDPAFLEPIALTIELLARQIEVLDQAIAKFEEQIEGIMKTHDDAALFQEIKGAGKALAPRLLTAFGTQRDRFENAEKFACYVGIAPVTKQSGKTRYVHRRYACSKYLRQTFHEFAYQATLWCRWSKAYYELQRSRGMSHHAAIRKLAYRWIRILFRVWQTRKAYDEARYLRSLQQKNPDIRPFLEKTKNTAA